MQNTENMTNYQGDQRVSITRTASKCTSILHPIYGKGCVLDAYNSLTSSVNTVSRCAVRTTDNTVQYMKIYILTDVIYRRYTLVRNER
jgi:hypothetical protein